MSESLPQQMAHEWEKLEKKAMLGFVDLQDVSEFVRRWTLSAAGVPAEERMLILSLAGSACHLLTAQITRVETITDAARQAAPPRVSPAVPTVSSLPPMKTADQIAAERKLQQTREETRRIEEETSRMMAEAADARHKLLRQMTNPELFCPLCNQAYSDPTHGCRHCAASYP